MRLAKYIYIYIYIYIYVILKIENIERIISCQIPAPHPIMGVQKMRMGQENSFRGGYAFDQPATFRDRAGLRPKNSVFWAFFAFSANKSHFEGRKNTFGAKNRKKTLPYIGGTKNDPPPNNNKKAKKVLRTVEVSVCV